MSFAGSLEGNGRPDEDRFLSMVIISMAVHALILLFFASFSGFTPLTRLNAVPSYTPVTIISGSELAKPAAKEIHIQKAKKSITTKRPMLTQEKAKLKGLEASKMNLEKKALIPEKTTADQKPTTTAGRRQQQEGSSQQSTTAAPGQVTGDSFSVHGLRSGSGVPDIPEITVYTSIIIDRIMEAWFLPPSLKQKALQKNLVMVVGIRIDSKGGVAVQGIEQSSGDTLFDNYALSAIKKVQAESFPPLPDVYRKPYLDLGIRFHPSDVGS